MSRYDEILEQLRDRPRTWLVTGAAGFIGSHLVETLLQCGQRVVGLDNFATGKRRNVDLALAAAGQPGRGDYRFIHGDIRTLDTCHAACAKVDVVLHQAALGSVPRSLANPSETHSANVDGFLNMLIAARDAGVARFIYAASSSTYGDNRRLPMVEGEIGRPLSPYALTKYVDELYADVFARCYGMRTVGLRYFNVFGPRQEPDGPYAAVIPRWISGLLRNGPVHINGDGSTARDFCFIHNVVQANLLAATVDEPRAMNEVYNVAVGAQTSLNDLFLAIRRLVAEHHPEASARQPEHRDYRAGDVPRSQADVGKARSLLGYEPAWGLHDGLRATIDWYVSNLGRQTDALAA